MNHLAFQPAQFLQQGVIGFINWFLDTKAGRNPVRWKLLLWDMCVTPCGDQVDWPAFRLYRHARNLVGQYEEITKRAAQRGFGSEGNVHTALARTFRPAFKAWIEADPNWQVLEEQCRDGNFLRALIQRGEIIADRWDEFRALLEPADDWVERICLALETPLQRGQGLLLAVAHYPSTYAEFLLAVAFDVKQRFSELIPELPVNVARLEGDELRPQIESLNPAPNSLLIVPVAGTAAFLDLEVGLQEAGARRCHLLVFSPDAATAGRIETTLMLGYSPIPIPLSPWYRTEQPAHPAIPPRAAEAAVESRLLLVLAAFSLLHRRPTLALLAAATDLPDAQIQNYITGEAAGWVQFDPGTERAYWSSEEGSEAYVERFVDTPGKLRELYVDIVVKLAARRPEGWPRAALNLFKSMYQTGRLRLLRAVLSELETRVLLPGELLGAFAENERFQAQLDLARVYARAYLYEKAHDLLLELDVPENDPSRFDDFWNHQLLAAEILTRQVADTGKTCYFEAAEFICKDLDGRVIADAGRKRQIEERLADLYLEAGQSQRALDLLDKYNSGLSLFGQSLKARALAELGRFDDALKIPTVGDRPRGVQLNRQDAEKQDDYERRWSNHVEGLLGKPAREIPVEALHQAAQRALERGRFAEAQKLLEHARSHYRDNVHLAVAWARLLVESGRAEEAVRYLWDLERNLTGRDNLVVEGALYDALLELRRQDASLIADWKDRLRQIPDPIFDSSLRREHYLPSQYARLITLAAKAYRSGALAGVEVSQTNTAELLARLTELEVPAALNLAAQILADQSSYEDALTKLDRAIELAVDPQTKIRTFNTRARILLDQGRLHEAGKELDESERLDAGNSYTMLLRAEWHQRCGQQGEAAKLRQRAEELRRVS